MCGCWKPWPSQEPPRNAEAATRPFIWLIASPPTTEFITRPVSDATIVEVPSRCDHHFNILPFLHSTLTSIPWNSFFLLVLNLTTTPPFLQFNLQLGNYNSFEGVLYCRPHFDQLFKRTGSLDKSFDGHKHLFKHLICIPFFPPQLITQSAPPFLFPAGTPKITKPEKPADHSEVINLLEKSIFL